MAEATTDLIYEVLKSIQTRLNVMEAAQAEMRESLMQTREGLHRIEGHLLRI